MKTESREERCWFKDKLLAEHGFEDVRTGRDERVLERWLWGGGGGM